MHRLSGEPLRGKTQGGEMTAVTQAVVDHDSPVVGDGP